jgi:hypothetical protein
MKTPKQIVDESCTIDREGLFDGLEQELIELVDRTQRDCCGIKFSRASDIDTARKMVEAMISLWVSPKMGIVQFATLENELISAIADTLFLKRELDYWKESFYRLNKHGR